MAGTTGGSGVLPDGSTYEGPYDSTTYETDFKVGPGVAPEAELYALRVFGCSGSTNVTTEAIDWAVANDMDVINMSLGSSYGTKDDPSAVASSNAVAAGVVVVASAGNSGVNPYLTGSPGTGEGVVSVAAVDSAEGFPGAELTFGGTTIEAINANGAELPSTPMEIVVLEDDPATGDNEALGCTESDYTSNGIVAGGEQIAVTVRGSCARVARAVEGQKAGAAAVVMINNTADFPPYEGEILSNPDNGEAYTVTIPFLGVRGVLGSAPTGDGDALVAAEGESLTMASTLLANPAFRDFASFSSGGPRSGDSGLKPNVAAPGVSTFSAEVGSGSEGSFKSGTSMAAPHVAGVAALGVQAHPEWSADEVSSAVVTTADADGMKLAKVTRGGTGLVDVAQTVSTSVVAFGDETQTDSGAVRTPSLSFGFAESETTFSASKTVTVVNKGGSDQTYAVSVAPSAQSQAASVTVSPSSITVPAGGSATVEVSISADAASLPTTMEGTGQHAFFEISGNVELAGGDGDLAVSYAMVPRPSADLTVAPKKINAKAKNGTPLNLENTGAVATEADFYSWGLADDDDVAESTMGNGFDLRAAGAQSFPFGNDTLLVFAVSTWDRFSNAAPNEYDVLIDTNQDGTTDWTVLSYDSGAIRSGSANGVAEVWVLNNATGGLFASGFLADAPTDSSTILLPVRASQLGVTGAFDYTVNTFERGSLSDTGNDVGTYDPTAPVLSSTGAFEVIEPGAEVQVRAKVDREAQADQGTLGQLIVARENAAGAPEALLVPIK